MKQLVTRKRPVETARRDGPFRYHMQFQHIQCKVYFENITQYCVTLHRLQYEIKSYKTQKKGCFAGNCHTPSASGETSQKVADLLGWLHRRDESGVTNTLIRELEYIDKAEYQSMFRMEVDSFKFLLQKTTPTFCDTI